ncbi:MAG: GumC family protein [Pseudomonadota bacterium]
MSQRAPYEDDDLNLRTLFAAMRRNLLKVLVFAVCAGALTYVVLSMVAPRYQSEAQIQIAAKATNPFPQQQGQAAPPDTVAPRLDREAINTHVRALSAPDLLLRVAEKLNLADRAEFNPTVGAASRLDSLMRTAGLSSVDTKKAVKDHVLEAVKARLQVAAARETRYISIKFASSNAQLAAKIANTLAETYKSSLVEVPVDETRKVVKALRPKIDQLNKEVLAAEGELERFRATTGRTLTSGRGDTGVSLQAQRLGQLSQQLTEAEAARSQAQSRWQTARGLLQSNSADVLPQVQQSNTIQGLISQRVRLERQISEASASLLPAHPRMRQLNADLAGLRRSIRSEVRKVVQSLEKSYRASQIRVNDIARQMTQLRTELADTSGDDAQVRVLEAQARSKRSELQRLQRQLEDNKTLVATRSVPIEAAVTSVARPSTNVSFPKKTPISAFVMAASFALGMAGVVIGHLTKGGGGAVDYPTAPPPSGRRDQRGRPDRHDVRPEDRPDDRPDFHNEPSIPNTAQRAAVAGSALAATGGAAVAASASSTGTGLAGFRDRLTGGAAPAKSAISERLAAVTGGRTATPTEPREDRAFDVENDDDGVTQLADVADHLAARAEAGVGFRTMVVGDSSRINPVEEAVEIASLIAHQGHQVVVIDCSSDGVGQFELPDDQAGFTDLVNGDRSFDDVITNLEESSAHFIACGSPVAGEGVLDADSANLVLDALDEAYDHIVVTGDYGSARTLFELIQGRFDAGITITDARRRIAVLEESENSFLGFEVTDIDVIRFERSEGHAFATRRLELGANGAGVSG